MYWHSLTLCQYIFNLISLVMSIHFSNFAVEKERTFSPPEARQSAHYVRTKLYTPRPCRQSNGTRHNQWVSTELHHQWLSHRDIQWKGNCIRLRLFLRLRCYAVNKCYRRNTWPSRFRFHTRFNLLFREHQEISRRTHYEISLFGLDKPTNA